MENQPDLECTHFCEQCKHFYRHYVRTGPPPRYEPLNVGHCSNPRCRDKQTNTPACHRFALRHTS